MEEQEKSWENGLLPIAPPSGKNRIYNALVKTENGKPQENLFEISGNMIEREKENSKKALEELWLIKKTCQEKDIKVLDLLIDYYQKKLDSVRQKEERLKQISHESLKLIEDSGRFQHDLASLTQEIEECTQEISFLQAKQEKLQVKEKEFREKNANLGTVLLEHEKEILESLYAVILMKVEEKSAAQPGTSIVPEAPLTRPAASSTPAGPQVFQHTDSPLDILAETKPTASTSQDSIYKVYKPAEHSRFPKSIVKTDKGRILGEYYYDPTVYKNSRSYVFNGRYFVDQLRKGIELYRIDETNANILTDFVLMASDILNRIQTRPNIHFEVSTNEILNNASMEALMENIKSRDLAKIESFCTRYQNKIEMLRENHEMILAEQLTNFSLSTNNAG
jgi:hypothetical protein